MLDETKLVRLASQGDVDAFGALFDRYAKDIYQLALSMGNGRGEAEDLMQDTFLAAFEGIGRFERRASFKTWLIAILFRQASRQRRYLGIRTTEVFDETRPAGAAARTGADGVHDSRLDVHAMLDSLSADHRAVLVLRELQGLSYDEIAETLEIPRGTVESRLFRARTILRERFQEYGVRRVAERAPGKQNVESRHE